MFKTKATHTENAIAEARKAISIADQTKSRCATAEAEQASKRATFEGKVYDAVLSGAELPTAEHLARAGEVTQALSAAHGKLCARAVESIQSVYRAGATAARAEAAQKRKQAEEIVAACRGPLAKLSELEDVRFDYSVLLGQRTGVWIERFCGMTAPSEFSANAQCGPDPTNPQPFAAPRSRILLLESDTLDAKAADLEARAEGLYGDDLDALLAEAIRIVQPAVLNPEAQAA